MVTMHEQNLKSLGAHQKDYSTYIGMYIQMYMYYYVSYRHWGGFVTGAEMYLVGHHHVCSTFGEGVHASIFMLCCIA